MLIIKKIINTFNKVFSVRNKPVFKLVCVYFTAHFLLLLNKTVIHDGWFVYPLVLFKKYDALWELYYNQAKLYNFYYFLKFISFAKEPLFIFKCVAFLSWLIAGICIYYILRDFVVKSKRDVFIISSLYLLSPVFFTRFEISIVHYSINNALFFSGVLIYLKLYNKQRLYRYFGYFVSVIFFIISFWTRSFLVFYFGFLALLFYITLKEKQYGWRDINFNLFLKICYKNIFFLLLPFIFYFVDLFIIGKPTGEFLHYNEFLKFNFHDASRFLEKLWQSIVYGFFWPIIQPLAILQRKIFAVVFIGLIVPLYLFLKKEFSDENENKSGIVYALIGAFLFFIGFFPYLLVGKAPIPYSGGNSMRHAVLLPLGSAFLILGFFYILFKEKWITIVFSCLFSLLIISNIFNYFLIDMDYYKQTAFIENLSQLDSAKNSSDVIMVIDDRMGAFNWGNRGFSVYEYEGYIMKINNGALVTKPISLDKYVKDGCPDKPILYVKLYSTNSPEPIVKDWIYLKLNSLFGDSKTEPAKIISTLGVTIESVNFSHGLPIFCSPQRVMAN